MNKLLFILSVVFIGFFAGLLTYQLSNYSLAEQDLEGHIAEKIHQSMNAEAAIQVEEIKDVGNYRNVLFTILNPVPSDSETQMGLAVFKKGWIGIKYQFVGAGWGTNPIDAYLLHASASTDNKADQYLVVYGRNPSTSQAFERFSIQLQDELLSRELSDRPYFVEIFPVTVDGDKNVVSSIRFDREGDDSESYPLIITSRIR